MSPSCTLSCTFELSSSTDKNSSPGVYPCRLQGPADPSSPSLPQIFTSAWAPSPRHNFEALVLPNWTDATHVTTQHVMPQTGLSFKSRNKNKEFQCYLAYPGNSHFFENFIFFRISQSTKFLSLRRLPTSKMSGFDIAPIYFQKHTKWAVFHTLLLKNAETNFPNTSKLLPDGGQPMRNSIQMMTVFKTSQMAKSAWPSWIFSCRRCTQVPAVRISHVLSCRSGLLVPFAVPVCCILWSSARNPVRNKILRNLSASLIAPILWQQQVWADHFCSKALRHWVLMWVR